MNTSVKVLSNTLRRIHVSPTRYGSEGSIREAGGAFGKKEAAIEEQYFRKLQAEQIKNLQTHTQDEIAFHEKKIKEHQEALERAKGDLKKYTK